MKGHPIEHLDAFLDDALPERDRRAVESHLLECASCRHELTRARALRDRLSAVLRAPAHAPRFEVLPDRRRSPVYAQLAVAAVVVGFALVGRIASGGLLQTAPIPATGVVAHVPQAKGAPVTVLASGQVLVGNRPVPVALAGSVRQTLAPVARKKERAASLNEAPIRLLMPDPADQGAVEAPATLAWEGASRTGYELTVERWNGKEWLSVEGYPMTVSGVSAPAPCFQEGDFYRWRVSAGSSASDYATLRVVTDRERQLLASAERDYGENSLVVGSLYSSYGLLTHAERVFAMHAGRHPEQKDLQQVLAQIRGRMSRPQ